MYGVIYVQELGLPILLMGSFWLFIVILHVSTATFCLASFFRALSASIISFFGYSSSYSQFYPQLNSVFSGVFCTSRSRLGVISLLGSSNGFIAVQDVWRSVIVGCAEVGVESWMSFAVVVFDCYFGSYLCPEVVFSCNLAL